ncbi:hypothetical protein O181_003617 [Austropuccinia psidii MF-1]|uniref:Uncharacterized protein n=1 Tax=Austropuccinia psidii MF-1 TaxID=1389203 RepID=A0A9Q3GF22_9BASI|nr:hypothetical protein [Austropuccinia psidii MF-1]
MESQGASQRKDHKCSESEDQVLETMDTIIDGRTLRVIIPTLPSTPPFNGNLKPEDWKDMDQGLKLHQFPRYLFQWSMDNKRFNLASHWEHAARSYVSKRYPSKILW